MDSLTLQQRAKVNQLQQFTTCPTSQGIRVLKSVQWNVEGEFVLSGLGEEGSLL